VLKIPAISVADSPASDLSRQKKQHSKATPIGREPLDSGIELGGEAGVSGIGFGRFWQSSAWIAAVLGGIGLLAGGVFLISRGDRVPPIQEDGSVSGNHDEGIATPDDDEKGRTVFRPQIKSDRPDDSNQVVGRTSTAAPPPVNGTAASVKRSSKDTGTVLALADFGVPVPAGATGIEVDGVSLPLRNIQTLTGQRNVTLVLPLGKHVVRFSKGDTPRVVEPSRWFIDGYREAMARVQEGVRWDFDRLLDLSRQSLDRFSEPLVPHFWGNYYWQEGEFEAAARHYTWALEITPTFAPAYFNLAALHHQQGNSAAAHRYLRLADLWNIQNAYGLSAALGALRGAMGALQLDPDNDDADWYISAHDEMTVRDRDMIAVLQSSAEFAPRLAERAKILNNLGAYFEHTGRPEYALQSYRSAAAVLAATGVDAEERRVILGILENLARVCRSASMPEYRRYERLQAMMQ
jgi:tetratricopeptide (TPR) repeat protein